MPPEDDTTPAKQDDRTDLNLPRLFSQAAWAASGVILVVFGLVLTVQLVWRKDAQYAGNWVNGIAALGAVLNVLLTLYILRAALGQLDHLREDLHAREKALELQAQQARADLERTMRQLDTQTEALALARSDAQQAQRETAMARLDVAAPRCSLQLYPHTAVTIYGAGEPEGRTFNFPPMRLEDHQYILKVELAFILRNWGDEPVSYSAGYPFENPVSGAVLVPGQEVTLRCEVQGNPHQWIRIARNETSVPSYAERDANPWWMRVAVVVDSMGVDVVDTLVWGGEVRPVEVNGDSLRILEGEIINARHAAVRHRDYVALRKAAESAKPEQ